MKLTPAQARATQIHFWVAALRGIYNETSLLYWAARAANPRWSEAKLVREMEPRLEEGLKVSRQLVASLPLEIKKDVLKAYKKSLRENP